MERSRRAVLAALGSVTTAGCTAPTLLRGQEQSSQVSLLLNWKPNGLHVPYYAARDRGYYREHGVELANIETGQGSDFSAKQVGLGNVPLAITSADQVLNVNSRGLSPVSAGVVMQRSPVVVFATRDSLDAELTSADQLAGKRVGTGPGMVRLLTRLFLERAGVLDDVTLVDTGYTTVQQLLAGKVAAAGGVFGDAVVARDKGAAVESIPVATAVPSYGHVVATDPEFASSNADAVTGFLTATARGAAWAAQNPEGAVDVFVDANPSASESRTVARETWTTLASEFMVSAAVRDHGWGWSEARPWQVTYDAMRDADLLGGSVDPGAVWTNDYLDTDATYVADYADRDGIDANATAADATGAPTTNATNATETG